MTAAPWTPTRCLAWLWTLTFVACSDQPADPTSIAPIFTATAAGTGRLVVDPDGRHDATTIQAGIDMAPAGGRVLVRPGTYNGAVVINKGLTLEAARGHEDDDSGRGTVIMEQTLLGGGPVIQVLTSQAVVIRGLTIHHVNGVGITARPVGGANLTLERMTVAGEWTLPPPVTGAGLNMSHNTAQSGGRSRLVVRDSRLSGVSAALRLFGDVDVVIQHNAFDVNGTCLVVSPTGTGGGVVPAGALTNVDIINNDFNHCGSNAPGSDGNGIRVEGTVGATTLGTVNIIGNRFRNTVRTAGDCNATAILYEFYLGRIEHNSFRNVVQECAAPTGRSLPGAIFVGSLTTGMPPSSPVVRFNDFVENQSAGLRIASNITLPIDASCNYWGSRSGPTSSAWPPGTGDAVVVEAGGATPMFTPFAKRANARSGDHHGHDDDDDDAERRSDCGFGWSQPVNLGTVINSPGIDQNPSLAADGLTLYFTSDRAGGVGAADFWVSRRPSLRSAWGPPVNIGNVINTAAAEGAATFSPDGRLLFFFSTRPGGFGEPDIYVSRRADPTDDFAWETPVNLGPYVNTATSEQGSEYVPSQTKHGTPMLYFNRRSAPGMTSPTDLYSVPIGPDGLPLEPAAPIAELNLPDPVSETGPEVRSDGLEILFFSPRPGTLGGVDIWRSSRRRASDPWSRPENLGTPINTPLAELHPSLSSDGRTLIFATARPGGRGNNDLWMSTRRGHDSGDRHDR